jgi:hypothetical protein
LIVRAPSATDLDAVAVPPAEQRPDGQVQLAAGRVVTGDVDHRLGVRVALDDRVHARVDRSERERIEPLDRRQQDVPHDVGDRLGRLAEVAHVGAAPRRERRRGTATTNSSPPTILTRPLRSTADRRRA